MKKKLTIFALLFALMVSMVGAVPVKAAEQLEWTNFAEYCVINGIELESLPIEYDASKQYMYTNYYGTYYLGAWDSGVVNYCSCSGYDKYSDYFYWKNCDSFYRCVDGSWTNIVGETTYVRVLNSPGPLYSDFGIQGSRAYYPATKTGIDIEFWDAIVLLSDSVKTELQGYENYIVQRNPYRVNDWKSEQIMITCSNAQKAILRDEAYNAVCFTTGSGKETGVAYCFDSHSMTWQKYDSSYAYSLGSTEESGGEEPEILWSSVDIYYEDGISYALSDEVWQKAKLYGDVTPTPVPEKNVVTDGFPRLYEVSSPTAIMYEEANSSSKMLVVMTKGKSGIAKGVTYDTDGKAWYEVTLYNSGNTYNGYVQAESLDVGYSVPTSGDTTTTTPTPTQAPAGGSGSSGDSGLIDTTWYFIHYTIGDITYTGYVLGDFFDNEGLGRAIVNVDKVPVYEGMYVTPKAKHYLSEGVEVYIESQYSGSNDNKAFMENVDDLVRAMDSVPMLIGSMFSFLPDWCMTLVGVIFSVAVIFLGLKLLF